MTKTWFDPRIPAAEDCVLRDVLEKWARLQPDKVFARFADGSEWTYRQTLEITRRTAAGFRALGVQAGENVHSWLPNGPDAIRVWFGLNYLGAVYVPINLAYRGRILEHAIGLSGARLIVAHAALIERLHDIDLGRLADLVVLDGAAPAADAQSAATAARIPAALRLHPASSLAPATFDPAAPACDVKPWDLQTIIYTSGTTGPSKGVMSSYVHATTGGNAWPFIGRDDRQLVILPLFHVGGTGAVYAMLTRGASVAIVDAFRTDTFWDVITAHQATFVILLGSMATLLAKRPPSAADRQHTLRCALMIPLLEDAPSFSARFGIEIYTLFNMTEISCPIISGLNPTPLATCGRPRPGVEVRIVDDNDCEVAPGAVGELIVRSDVPWSMNSGYYGNAEATARAWRNGWFHTGDAFRVDGDGNYFFVDRMKDAIRRRGENISSFEVEAEINGHPDVLESAAVAVPSEHGEDEVLAVVVMQSGRSLDPKALTEYLIPRMAHFMVPRYLRQVPELPRTPTQKVQKHLIRADGITADTWDREKAGIVVRRQRI
ncbi:MAG TPA: AMP-binding protein [Burkholderiaceae bacterium]|nr:AMP-binding protein [Burkholderiaceae bacterium]